MESAAHQLGVLIGMILGLVFMLGIPVLFIVSLVLAILKKTRAWTVIAVVTGLLSFVPVGLFSYGVYKGISRARSLTADDQEIAESREIVSDDLLCSLTLPPHWKMLDNLHEDASMQVGNLSREEYMILLTDEKADFAGSLAQHAEITSNNIVASMQEAVRSGPEEIEINGYPALRYEIAGTTDLVRVFYIQTTIEGERGFHQLVGWTLKSKIDRARGPLEQTTASFREIEAPG